ncbi:MAG: tetratricopeptide repeat protein, partial [Acidobacteriota bacterium]
LQAPVPTSIYVFRNDRSFTPYKNLYKGEPAAVSGYFVARRYGNFIAIDGSASDGSAIVFHEYVHSVVATNDWRLPLWFEEGLAEFYQSFQVVGDTVYLGLPIPQHLAYLNGSTPIPLTELLTVTRESPLYNEEQRKGAFYAQSWALVHYLLLGDPTRRQELGRYLEMLHEGNPEFVAFDQAFGIDRETLEGELRMYLKRDRLPYGTTRAEILPASVLDVRSMSEAETLYRLGELLLSQSSDRPEAVEHLATALQADPDLGRAAAALAVTAEMRGDADTARALYQRALRTAPDDPLVLLRWGEFLFRSENELDAAAAVLEKCAALDPGLAPAWVALAKVYADSGSSSEQALNAAETAHRLLLLRSIDQTGEPVVAPRPVQTPRPLSPTVAELEALNRYLADADFEGAERFLEELRARTSGEQRLWVDSKLREVRRAVEYNRFVEAYNRAITLYNDGDYSRAIAVLEELLSGLEEGPDAAAARQLLDDSRSAQED